MRVLIAVFFIIGLSTASAQADVQLDQATKDHLEGIWLSGRKPDKGPCISARYAENQVEFEFRKTGGRTVHFEPNDPIRSGASKIESARRDGNVVTIKHLAPEGGVPVEWRIHLGKDRDAFSIVHIDRNNGAAPTALGPMMAYRCGAPDQVVSGDVPTEMLQVLTPLNVRPGPWALAVFFEQQPGVPSAEQCTHRDRDRRMLFFEVFGPVHYFVTGVGFKSRFDFAAIREIRKVGGHTLALTVIDRPTGKDKWGSGVTGDVETLTIELDEPRIHIAELDATFIRCDRRTGKVFD
ncbi:MAG: hypothetical protein HOP13_02825 [Alphaproteobacteria bacterium]|nr:hypothetical protein [Alphaproteobacteria bacterium]